jgi:methylmalonyl-CoA mutase N-terminal domain/subunit
MRERFGAKSDRACMLRFHTQTAGSSLTAQQPLVNIVRTTVQALASVLGGTQSLHTNSFDEALGLPTEEAATLALRVQQILASESGLANWIDPLGGSYAVEHLTSSIEKSALDRIEQIDEQGGMVKAVELGIPQRAIEESAYAYQRGVEDGTISVVGVNTAVEPESGERKSAYQLDPGIEAAQCERIQAYRHGRDGVTALEKLSQLRMHAAEGRNILPATLAAVEARATLGEISDVLREVFGEYEK